MAEEKKKVKKTVAKKDTEAKKVVTKKATVKKTVKTEKKTPAKTAKKVASAVVTVTQTGSPIGRKPWQRATLIGLGLNKMNRTRTLEDTAAVRGMIDRVKHLIRVENAA